MSIFASSPPEWSAVTPPTVSGNSARLMMEKVSLAGFPLTQENIYLLSGCGIS